MFFIKDINYDSSVTSEIIQNLKLKNFNFKTFVIMFNGINLNF